MSEQQNSTPADVMSRLNRRLESGRLEGIEGTFAFIVSGPDGGSWWVEVHDGTGVVHLGVTRDATVTVRARDQFFVHLFGDPALMVASEACFTEELVVEGDTAQATVMARLFGADEPPATDRPKGTPT